MSERHTAVSAMLVAAGTAALVHAGLAWSPVAALRFGLVAAGLAFVAEAVVVRAGWLVHRLRPRAFGVPLPVLAGWIAATYVAYRVAVPVAGSPGAPLVAAVVATAADLLGDPVGVRLGLWEYPRPGLVGPRIRGVPWWNFAGWLVLTWAVVALGTPA